MPHAILFLLTEKSSVRGIYNVYKDSWNFFTSM